MTRLASAAEATEVATLLARFQQEYGYETPPIDVLAARVTDHIDRDLSTFVLAGPPGVGIAQLRFREYLFTGAPMVYLEELYVVPDRRGEGLGRAIMERAMDEARGRGATTIELGTATDDTAARGLYEALGFTNLERPGEPASSMLYYEREL